MKKSVLVLDCGATNVKACLVDESGSILATHSESNETTGDPFYNGGLIWDIHEIWKKLTNCAGKVCSQARNTEIAGITATSFGVDGAPLNNDGTLLYPVISWQCSRTQESEKLIEKYFDRDWLYNETGLQSYHFNTINKLIWLMENRPEVFDGDSHYTLMPSLILRYLSGSIITDTTMAGTTMLTSLLKRKFSDKIFKKLNLETTLFPPLVEPGSITGKLSKSTADTLGISAGIPVIAAGHDTQFAIIGSGARVNEPVLSSGTWEILMTRTITDILSMPDRQEGVTIELDASLGITDIGVQWVASGVTEWLGKILYNDLDDGKMRYDSMISDAGPISPGSNGVRVIPEIYPGGFSGKSGAILGFTHDSTRAHIYRATLEALSYYTRYAIEKLKIVGNFTPERLLCVGGGSKNSLWNQLRADVLELPVEVPDVKEATAIGAAMVAFKGLGVYESLEDARVMLKHNIREFLPGSNQIIYRELYEEYVEKVIR